MIGSRLQAAASGLKGVLDRDTSAVVLMDTNRVFRSACNLIWHHTAEYRRSILTTQKADQGSFSGSCCTFNKPDHFSTRNTHQETLTFGFVINSRLHSQLKNLGQVALMLFNQYSDLNHSR